MMRTMVGMAPRSRKQAVRAFSGVCVLTSMASAQGMHWNSNVGLPSGLFGTHTYAMTTYDDGSGRAVYVESTGNVSRRSGNTWVFVGGSTFNDEVLSLCEYDAGQGARLYAGGLFTALEGDWHPLPALAVLDQGLWQPLPGGVPITQGVVESMVVFDDGGGGQALHWRCIWHDNVLLCQLPADVGWCDLAPGWLWIDRSLGWTSFSLDDDRV